MRVGAMQFAAKVCFLIGSLVLIIGLFSPGLPKQRYVAAALLPIRTDSLASIT